MVNFYLSSRTAINNMGRDFDSLMTVTHNGWEKSTLLGYRYEWLTSDDTVYCIKINTFVTSCGDLTVYLLWVYLFIFIYLFIFCRFLTFIHQFLRKWLLFQNSKLSCHVFIKCNTYNASNRWKPCLGKHLTAVRFLNLHE